MKKVNEAHKSIVNKLGLQDRVFKTTDRECFISLKDHKNDFTNSPSCRLLNPTKCEIGRISHQILSRIVTIVRSKTYINQWKNVYSCIGWFENLQNKKNSSFIVFDIVSFYPTISQELLELALDWAREFIDISEEEKNIILESRKSHVVFGGSHWTKKKSPGFDVPMGGFDSAEICDLVGLFLLSKLEKLNLNVKLGIYKDDGLGVTRSTPRQAEAIKKKICATFREYGLEITIEANKKSVQFLDVEFDLEMETFKPFLKPGDTPTYVHAQSNHPPSILRNIPEAINRRLSNLSSDEQMFQSVAPVYQEALERSGYKFKLEFKPQPISEATKKRKRKRDILWWNPPYSTSVKTKVGMIFFKLLDLHFPKDNPLSKILNRNTVKMSYRTTPNFKKIINSHNATTLKPEAFVPPCNCRKKELCPLNPIKCRTRNVVYQATVIPTQNPAETETYTGMTSTEFKDRYRNHTKSFNNLRYSNETTLSLHIWSLKNMNIDFDIQWKVIDRAKPFSPVTGVCNLCTLEKYYIIFKPEGATLNKNEEIYKPCIHRRPLLLDNT